MMYTLVIDTSTEQGVVAILKGTALIKESLLPFGYNQSNHLLPYVHSLFQDLDMTPQQLDYIAVGVGPGSYTGIRVGASVAKTIAYACNKPLVGICTLEAFIPKGKIGPFAAIIDAKISGCYLLKGIWTGEDAIYEGSPLVVSLDQLPTMIEQNTLLVTPYAQMLKAKIDKLHPGAYPHWTEMPPCPKQLGYSALKKLHESISIDGKLDLLYLRETEAEREKNKNLSFLEKTTLRT